MRIHFSEHELLKQYVEQHAHFTPMLVDVGAHRGGVTRQYAQLGWKVIAFEPEPKNYRGLLDTVSQFDTVTVIHKAVSDSDAEGVDFYVSPVHNGIHSLRPFDDSHTEKITVETVRLDEVLRAEHVDAVGYLKIDIEGADLLALRSFDFDAIRPQLIMVEFMDSRTVPNFNYTYHDMVAHLAPYGYRAWISEWAKIEVYGGAGQKDTNVFIQCVPYPVTPEPAWGNLIFVPQNDSEIFQQSLNSYLVRQTRAAQIAAFRQSVERFPLGNRLIALLRQIRNGVRSINACLL